MKQLHETQLQILKRALFASTLRYSELKPDPDMENNQFDFHLDQLIKNKLIEKNEKNYKLTNSGKEYANRMDTEQTLIQKQAKIGTMICCIRTVNGQDQYLVYTRLKQPFYGCQGFPTGKVAYGEKVIETAQRELQEETGLYGKANIVAIKHYLVLEKSTKELLEDKFLYLCLIKNPKGKLTPNDEGKFAWVYEKDIPTYVTNHFESLDAFLQQINLVKSFTGEVKVEEVVHESSKF